MKAITTVSPRAKKEKEAKNTSPFTGIIRWFTGARQYLVAFGASIAAFGVLQSQLAKIDWANWVADTVAVIPLLLVFFAEPCLA